METRKPKKDEWIKLASKSRPGRYYLFNKSTGETQWLPQESSTEATTSGSKKESPPKLSLAKANSKTPAQDRLKRLQNNLKANQIKPQSSKSTRHTSDTELKPKKAAVDAKEQENRKDLPSTSSLTKSKSKTNSSSPRKPLPSPKRANKRQHSTTEVEQEKQSSSVTPPKANKTPRFSQTSNTATASTSNRESIVESEIAAFFFTPLVNNKDIKQFQNENDTKPSTLNSIRTGIVKKIKEICKIPFTSKKPPDESSNLKEQKTSSHLVNTTPFKPARKTKDNKQHLSASLQEAIHQLKAEQEQSTENTNLKQANTLLYSTPKNLNIPTYQRGSANSRLERLRQSLQLQQPSTSASAIANVASYSSKSGAEATNNLPTALNTSLNNSTNSIYQTANNTINDEVEAMDWQPIIKDEPIEISSSESIVSNVFKRPSVKKAESDYEGLTMGDIYDTVNENLLRFSAEKHKDSSNNNKWQKDYYYFIADTNVLLRDLCFVEDLSKMKLCDTKGSMLYIPYSVLQELDRLKMRSGCQEGVKTLAVRAIKYLNTKFENKSNHLQAQSALEERHRLIDINSADDSIINCCLQAKERVPNLILLTEDVNLRNKAISNNILVSTKSDLVSKHYDKS